MSSNQGPSAHEVAEAVRYRNLASQLSVDDPKTYEIYVRASQKALLLQGLFWTILCLPSGIAFLRWINGPSYEDFPIGVPIFSFVLAVGVGLVGLQVAFEDTGKPGEILDAFEMRKLTEEKKMKEETAKANERINEDTYLGAGIKIVTGEKSNVVIGNNIQNSYSIIEKTDTELAQAIATLVGFVNENGSDQSREALGDLVDELEGEQKPSRVKAFWNALVSALPQVAGLTTAAAKIIAVFSK